MFKAEEIIDIIKIHPLKVRNIYMFGSRVYENHYDDSDYDFIVLASTMDEKKEYRHENLNIHVHVPNVFKDGLNKYYAPYIECIFAPGFAKIQEKLSFCDFKINKDKLVDKGMKQAYSALHNAKMKLESGDLYRAVKSIYHSIRILDFFNQIKEHDKIIDYTSSNYVWDMLKVDFENDEYEWDYYKEKYLPIKIELENKILLK